MDYSTNKSPILLMKNIHVNYGKINALKGVDFDLLPGEIHGLVGEHRAGKSTLVRVLSGAVEKQHGEIILFGEKIDNLNPGSSIKHKIGILYQNLNIIPSINAIENIFAGKMPIFWKGFKKYGIMVKRAKEIFSKLKVNIDLEVPLGQLSTGQQCMVELARVLSFDPDILIFDEISSKLTPLEMEIIYSIIFDFKKQNKSIIYISHNMDEIFEFADRVTIMKDGLRRGTEEIKDLDKIKLINMTYSFVLSREELQLDNKELYALKKHNENIIKNLPVGVAILDIFKKVYLVNYAFMKILNLHEKEIINQYLEKILDKEFIDEKKEIFSKIDNKEEYTWNEIKLDNNKIVKINIFPFKDEDYKNIGTILLIEDITKDYFFKDYLLRTEKITSVAELAAGIAHEINNPLGVVLNYIKLIEKQNLVMDQGKNKLEEIEVELIKIKEIVESLLSFSKMKNLPMKPINLVTVINDVILLLNHKFKEKNINLKWSNKFSSIEIEGSENRLRQVFINLIINSIEAVLNEGNIEITTNIDHKKHYVEVLVIDDGYGIPKEIMNKIFNPFFSTKPGKNNTGLGLSICQYIIEMHQGIINCYCKDKTVFSVRLPML